MNKLHGFVGAITSATAFGLIPLFSLPVLATGMSSTAVLVYRFAFACLVMLVVLMYQRKSLHLHFGESLRLMLLSVVYTGSAVFLIEGYRYLSSGIATVIMFSYPAWTALLMMIFRGEKASVTTFSAIGLAVAGVCFLSGIENGVGNISVLGICLELLSGLSYAIYMVAYPTMNIRNMPTIKVNFYIFFFTMLLLTLYAIFTSGGLPAIHTGTTLLNLFLLGLLPTVVSNITLILALKNIGSTLVAILGAFEPLTAMCIGIAVFGEPFTTSIGIGFVLILIAVVLLVLKKSPAEVPTGPVLQHERK